MSWLYYTPANLIDSVFCDNVDAVVRPDTPSSYTYFIRARGTNRVKIGRTNNLKQRLATYETHCPYKCDLLYTLPSHTFEARFKAVLNRLGLRIKGEWYEYRGCVQDLIKHMKKLDRAAKKIKLVECYNEDDYIDRILLEWRGVAERDRWSEQALKQNEAAYRSLPIHFHKGYHDRH